MKKEKREKNEKSYATVENDGTDYRKIAEIMTGRGFPMNHSQCKKLCFKSNEKICNRGFVRMGVRFVRQAN